MRHLQHTGAITALLVALCASCGGATPRIAVLGLDEPPGERAREDHTIVVFLEVVNPTSLSLQLSRLRYQLSAGTGAAGEAGIPGEVALARVVTAGATAVVEIPVTLPAASPPGSGAAPGTRYTLSGELFAAFDHLEHSWPVETHFTLADGAGDRAGDRARAVAGFGTEACLRALGPGC